MAPSETEAQLRCNQLAKDPLSSGSIDIQSRALGFCNGATLRVHCILCRVCKNLLDQGRLASTLARLQERGAVLLDAHLGMVAELSE